MRLAAFLGAMLLVSSSCQGQMTDKVFEKAIDEIISYSVPLITVDELQSSLADQKAAKGLVMLDTRTKKEFQTSHIDGARFIDYNGFKAKDVADLPKDAEIVVYCSVGYRSEKIGEQLQELGFNNVRNLYGGVFQWVNTGKPIVDKEGAKTDTMHGYDAIWSKFVRAGEVVY